MRSAKKLLQKLVLFVCLFMTGPLSYAQDAKPVTETSSSGNELVLLLAIIMLVLAFVIWGLGQVLAVLGRQLLDKNKAAKALPLLIIGVLTVLSQHTYAQQTTQAISEPVANYGGLNSTGFWTLSIVLVIEVAIIFFMMFFIRRIQVELLPPQQRKHAVKLLALWARLDKKLFTKAIAVEREADIMLDHDYDGIRELDNSLPPWWKYGFVVTIGIALIYLVNFHVLGYGKNPTEEYQAELQQAAVEQEIYEANNKDKVDETAIKMPGTDGINAGKEIFIAVCWACHGKTGEGGAGPNLTDDYWLHKGSLTDIYFSIKHGYPDKGMQAWEKSYSPKDINNLAGFVKTLVGTKPVNPKAPQGDLFLDNPASDSAEVQKDKKQLSAMMPAVNE